MEPNSVINDPDNPTNTFLKKNTYIIGIFIILLIVANIVINQMLPLEKFFPTESDGSSLGADAMRTGNIVNILIVVPIIGFIIGALLSFIPFKAIPYKGKILRFSIIVILVLYIAQFISYLLIL